MSTQTDTITRRQWTEQKKKQQLLAQKKRLLIHVAGSPAAGKTTLMNQLTREIAESKFQSKRPCLLKDTDAWAAPLFKSDEYKRLTDEGARGEFYREHMKSAIAEFAQAHPERDLVLFGLTMYWAWDSEHGFDDGEAFVVVPSDDAPDRVIYNYFIRLSDQDLVARRFHRDVEVPVKEEKKEFLSGAKTLDFSAPLIRQYAHVEKKQYVDNRHYQWLSLEHIGNDIRRLLASEIDQERLLGPEVER